MNLPKHFGVGAVARILLVAMVLITSASRAESLPQVARPKFPAAVLSVTNFGAVGDGRFLNTEAFANAFAALAAKGGGELDVPPGFWLTGPIQLRSHINLHLAAGALLQFSGDFRLYPLTVIDLKGEKEVDSVSPISGRDLEDVAITGAGIIDGAGDAWRPMKKGKLPEGDWKNLVNGGGVLSAKGDTWWPSRAALDGEKLVGQLRQTGSLNVADYEPAHQFLRPKMLRLIHCNRVLLDGITVQNPPNWTLNPVLCEDVSILNVSVRNSPNAQNSDALDLESCRRAQVRGCTFDVGDDGICLKSGKDAAGRRIGVPTEDVLVEDCVVYHAHGGFTIGSEMSGGVRRVRVNNCVFLGTEVGLRFKSTRGRGGVVENIFISNVRMQDIAGDAINFNLYYGGKSPLDDDNTRDVGRRAATAETPQFRGIQLENIICRGAEKAIVLQGLPEMPIRDIHLHNVSINSRRGVFLMDATAITLEQTEILNRSGPVLNFFHTQDCEINQLHYAAGVMAVAAVQGSGTSGIVLRNIDFKAAQTNFISGEISAASMFEVK